MSSPRLLVIDDSMTIRKLVELSLRGSAWTTEFAASGEEGISRAKQSPPDLILLDFVLPDMRGSDVCARLSKNPATARVPVLVMSAKHENVRELFRDFPQVADFVPKPFNAAEIQSRLERLKPAAAPDASANDKPAARSLTFQQKEAAAHAIYARMHPLLSQIPELMAGLGGQAPAPYFARKLLTPALIEELVDALLPVLAEAAPSRSTSNEIGLKGKLGSLPLYELLRTLTQGAQSGELIVGLPSGETRIALSQGEIVAVSSGDALQTEPKRLLLAALQAPQPSVSWREVATAAGAERVVSLSEVELDYLRHSPPWSRIAAALPSGALVVERAPGFSQRLAGFELREDERRVLALVDGKATLDELGQRASTTPRELGAVVHRLVTVGLLRATRAVPRVESRRPVLVADPDLETFQRPLQRLLAERQRPLELLGLALDEELYGAIVRERPRMVILNVTALGDQARKTALALRAGPDFRDVPLVAVLEAPASELMAELSNAGFDAVLSKPLLFSDLEDLLVA